MEFTTANPFIPKASVIRYPNATFEARIHLPGAAADVDVVPHENFILVTGSLATRVRVDAEGKPSALIFTDQPCGVFGRDIPVNLTAGTELVVLSVYQDCDDYVVRYTIRNSITPRANCADLANAAAAGAAGAAAGCKCPPGMKGSCGGAVGGSVGPGRYPHGLGFAHPGYCAVPPAVLGRGPYGFVGGFGYGYGGYAGAHAGLGYGHPHGFAHGAGFAYGAGFPQPRYTHSTHGHVFHPNGGATA